MDNSHYYEHLPALLDADSSQTIRAVAGKLEDAEFRKMARENPKAAFAELGYSPDFAGEVEVRENGADKVYLVVPHVDNADRMGDVDLAKIQGGGVAFCIGTAGTVGSATPTVSTASTAATLGSLL